MDTQRLHFMAKAIELAEENVQNGGGPFGAVIVKNGEIIATGANRVTDSNDPTAHAEVVAIRKACQALGSFQLDDCELYASCEPCPMCLGAIYWARPKAIYFAGTKKDAAEAGFDDSFIYKEIAMPFAERSIQTSEIRHPDKLRPFEAWNSKEDKVEY